MVKPTISAGSKDTLRVTAGRYERSITQVEAILDSGRTVLVQPYIARVDEEGETALIYIDGQFSHAIRKGPILERGADTVDGLYAGEEISPREATDRELAVGSQAVATIPGSVESPPLYARVDLLPNDKFDPLVLEVELAEPSLFLQHCEPSAACLATAIRARLDEKPRRSYVCQLGAIRKFAVRFW